MANKFYAPGEQRAAKVNDLFATIARRYDLLNDLQSFGLHRRWKRRAVALAQPQPGDRALDVCCGTGDLAQLLAATGAEVTAVDFSAAMLEVAEQRQRAKGKGQKVEFQQGDAMQLAFADARFEIVTIGYGLRNLASVDAGLRELRRVLKPGGRLVILEFGKPTNVLWRWIYFQHLRFVTPLLGKLFCGDAAAYAYILESLQNYPGQEGVAQKLRDLGLTEVRAFNLLGGAMSLHFARQPLRHQSVA
ncbi:MAG: demethylmenaquinone methyltransferase [Verrucomicrobiota bacterium]|jgi:demethylmenaquinone methyltransferase/2-methoxy-6-polyprenyl-1,4-benzoquinol methylase